MSTTPYIVPHCDQDIDILYRDEHLLLVNKPTLLLSVPGRHPKNRDCVISRLQQHFPTATIVHRLDLDTSGIMVIALNRDTHRELSRQFEQRQIQKTYEAIVFGVIEKTSGTIELPLICDWPNRPRQMVDHQQGKYACTHFEVLSSNREENCSRILLKPVTGRSHQLRVHMAAIEHPILGCDFYAHKEALKQSKRLLLHATGLTFKHPVTGTLVNGNCPAPF